MSRGKKPTGQTNAESARATSARDRPYRRDRGLLGVTRKALRKEKKRRRLRCKYAKQGIHDRERRKRERKTTWKKDKKEHQRTLEFAQCGIVEVEERSQ